uniref:Si:ch211-241f5.3 n=1 Tax=Sinocyclocheilus anshuiensis TaxID=1608454 RepID=A0A671R9K3_9TELE
QQNTLKTGFFFFSVFCFSLFVCAMVIQTFSVIVIEDNECVSQPSICGKNARCFNTVGSYYCQCHEGFTTLSAHNFTQADAISCKDINECVVGSADCSPNTECVNSEGGYKCTCATGYISSNSGQGVQCIGKKLLDLTHLLEIHTSVYIPNFIYRVNNSTNNNNKSDLFIIRQYKTVSTVFVYQPGFTTAALLSYKGLEESLNGYFDHLETQQKQTFKINSKVVTATVSNKETDNLTKPVNLTFSHLEKKNEKHKPMCVFWDPELEGGAWSTRGCTTVRSSADQTVCSCSHLSSFAVLMALYDIGLRLVTLVGLPLSLICLLICIVTFYFVRSIQSTRNTIHLHLCISLFIAYFVFLVGITRTENKVGCAVVAGILHYFFLASFCWMCLEGVQLFRMVVLVFNTTLRPIYMFAAGYGVPAVIVAISATVNASGYGTDNYCWLNIPDGFIWSFYGPVCVIIIVNVLFFLITIWKLAEKFSSLNPDLDSLHKIKAFTVTAIAQLCILGIMWVFGCFQFDENTLPMSYIFTILSSLQGVLMFILHCWLSKQVREEYAKFLSCICAPHKRKYSEFTSNQTSKLQVNSVSKRSQLALALRMCAQNLPSGCPRCR